MSQSLSTHRFGRLAGTIVLAAVGLLLWVPACGQSPRINGGDSCQLDTDCPATEVCGSDQLCHPVGGDDAGGDQQDAGMANPIVCQPCTSNADCGGTGNFCLQNRDGTGRFCGAACQSAANCSSGEACFTLTSSTQEPLGKNCYPTSGSCPSTTRPDAGTTHVDAGYVDAGHPDAGHVDAGTPDAGHVDAGTPDAGHPDAGTPDAGMPCTTDTWTNFAQGFFTQHCSNCHGHNFQGSYSTTVSEASQIKSKISSGSMPPGGGLPSSDKSRILKWISCGEPR